MPNIQFRNFMQDIFQVPARNVQSLLKAKIPARTQFFEHPSKIRGVKPSSAVAPLVRSERSQYEVRAATKKKLCKKNQSSSLSLRTTSPIVHGHYYSRPFIPVSDYIHDHCWTESRSCLLCDVMQYMTLFYRLSILQKIRNSIHKYVFHLNFA